MSFNKHKSIQPSQLSPKMRKVYLYLQNYESSTRSELSSGTGLKVCSICSVVNRLIKTGLVRVSGKVKDESSGVVVQKLAAVGEVQS